MVRGGAPGTGADEARPPAPSLPREIRAPARRGLPAPVRAPGSARLGSFRGLGHDPGRGERLRRAGGRLRHLRVQLPARAGEDGRVRAGAAARGRGAARGCRNARPDPGARPFAVPAELVRAPRARRAARLPRPDRRHRLPRPLAGRSLARGALGAACAPLRPRLPGGAGAGRVLLPQAPAHLPAGRGGGQVPPALRPGRSGAGARVRRGTALARRRSSCTATRACWIRPGASISSSPRRRTPA